METFWVVVVVLSGVIPGGMPGQPEGFVSGTIDQTTTYYFKTEDDCKAMQDRVTAHIKEAVAASQLGSGDYRVDACKAVQLKVEKQ